MKFLVLLLASASLALAQTNDVTKIRVTGDSVSLRLQPSLEGELLDRAMRGEEMVCLEQTNGWVAVQAPDSLNFWVVAQYIEDGVVQPKRLNVRSGPSRNYNVVAVVERDAVLSLRGEYNEWLKIAPPIGSRVWISADYVELIEPPKPEPVVVVVPDPEPISKPVPVVRGKPKVAEKVTEELPPLLLELDMSKPQEKVVSIPGVLRRANPGLYKLVYISGGFEEPICLVRGKESQLEGLLNRTLLIEGPMYWAKDVDLPIIEPRTIDKNPIIAD